MIKEFAEKWYKHKSDLEEYFRHTRQDRYDTYEGIVKALFENVINKDEEYKNGKFYTKDITVIDNGDYQGTQIIILHKDTYQPDVDDYVYTNTYYGSCSGCDTLLGISGYDYDYPSEEQVKEYMTLALHLLQKCKYFVDEEDTK